MYIDEEKKFIFFHNPKCAGTTVYSLFDHKENDKYIDARENLAITLKRKYNLTFELTSQYWKPFDPWHTNYEVFKEMLPHLSLDEYFKFCFVRNPYTKIYSGYTEFLKPHYRDFFPQPQPYGFQNPYTRVNTFSRPYRHPKFSLPVGYSFQNFVTEHSSGYQNNFYTHFKEKLVMDFIGRFENFEEDLKTICTRLDIPFDKKENRNRGADAGKNYLDFYTAASIQTVNQNCQKDFEFLGYEMLDPKDFPDSIIHTN